MLSERWTVLRHHPVQRAYWDSPHRFNTIPAGRRSGKTEIFKRRVVKAALRGTGFLRPSFFVCAPIRPQAKRLYWQDLKDMVPTEFLAGTPSESELVIRLVNGSEIHVFGMDSPERIEGSPWDGGGLDEYGNMRPQTWPAHVYPALADRNGWCDLFGVPEGRNHYYETDKKAKASLAALGRESTWGSFHWVSADILSPDQIAQAQNDLDELTFNQEYRASFVNFEGQAYYPFNEDDHCAVLKYDPRAPLIFCFDFNVEPGTASVVQEQQLPSGQHGTGIIGEVHIPRNSNTPAVCRKLVADWGKHDGPIVLYGDFTGGSRGTAKIMGTDWDLIWQELSPTFGQRIQNRVVRNPRVRDRLNSVNSRLKAMDGTVRMMVDPVKAPNVVSDFEGVRLLAGGSGEIDKKADPKLSHLTDGIGYYVDSQFPVARDPVTISELEL